MVKNSQNCYEDAHDSVSFSKFVDFWPLAFLKKDSVTGVFLDIFRNVLEQKFIKSPLGDASVTVSSIMPYRYYSANCMVEVEDDLERDILIIIFLCKKKWQKFFEIDFKVFSFNSC